MNTSLDNLTHKMQRAALGKIVDVALSRAEQDREKTMCQLVDAAKQFYGSGFSDETYENAKKVLTDPNSKWTKLINCVLDQTDPREPCQVPVQHPLADPVRPHLCLQYALRWLLGR